MKETTPKENIPQTLEKGNQHSMTTLWDEKNKHIVTTSTSYGKTDGMSERTFLIVFRNAIDNFQHRNQYIQLKIARCREAWSHMLVDSAFYEDDNKQIIYVINT